MIAFLLLLQIMEVVEYALKLVNRNNQALLYESIGALSLTIATILNQRLWIYYFIKIGEDASNPYV